MRPRRLLAAVIVVLAIAGCTRRPAPAPSAPPSPPGAARPRLMAFEATAYSIEGKTASGTRSRRGVVAADPDVLPLGSRIRVHDAGSYSGEYVVQDTGPAVQGREIDIYLANDAEAKRFGRRTVQVEVLDWGKKRGP
jgi:3D (Asp-Asp-Asp) domain-containing protein